MIAENDALIKKRYQIISIFMPVVCVLMDFLGLLISGFDSFLAVIPELSFTACFAFIFVFYVDLKSDILLNEQYKPWLIMAGAGLVFAVPSFMDRFGIALVVVIAVSLYCAFLCFDAALILMAGFFIYVWAFDSVLLDTEMVIYCAAILMVCIIIAFSDKLSKLVYSLITFTIFYIILNIIFNRINIEKILNMTVFTIWLFCIAVIVCLYFVKNIMNYSAGSSSAYGALAGINRGQDTIRSQKNADQGNIGISDNAGINGAGVINEFGTQGADGLENGELIEENGIVGRNVNNGDNETEGSGDTVGNIDVDGNRNTAENRNAAGNTSTSDADEANGSYDSCEIGGDAQNTETDQNAEISQSEQNYQNGQNDQNDQNAETESDVTANVDYDASGTETQDTAQKETVHQSNQALYDSIQELSKRLVKLESENSVLQLMLNSSVYDLQTITDPDYPYILKLKEESPKYYEHCQWVAKVSSEAAALINCDSEEAYAIGMYIKAPRILGDGASSILASTYKIPRNIISAVNKINNKINASVMTREAGIVMLTDDILNTINYLRSKNNGDVSIERIVNNTIKVRKEQNYLRSAGFTNEEIQLLRLYYDNLKEQFGGLDDFIG